MTPDINKLFLDILVSKNKLATIRNYYITLKNETLKGLQDLLDKIRKQTSYVEEVIKSLKVKKDEITVATDDEFSVDDSIYKKSNRYLQIIDLFNTNLKKFYERMMGKDDTLSETKGNYDNEVSKFKTVEIGNIADKWKFHYTTDFQKALPIEHRFVSCGGLNVYTELYEIAESRYIFRSNENVMYDVNYRTKDCYVLTLDKATISHNKIVKYSHDYKASTSYGGIIGTFKINDKNKIYVLNDIGIAKSVPSNAFVIGADDYPDSATDLVVVLEYNPVLHAFSLSDNTSLIYVKHCLISADNAEFLMDQINTRISNYQRSIEELQEQIDDLDNHSHTPTLIPEDFQMQMDALLAKKEEYQNLIRIARESLKNIATGNTSSKFKVLDEPLPNGRFVIYIGKYICSMSINSTAALPNDTDLNKLIDNDRPSIDPILIDGMFIISTSDTSVGIYDASKEMDYKHPLRSFDTYSKRKWFANENDGKLMSMKVVNNVGNKSIKGIYFFTAKSAWYTPDIFVNVYYDERSDTLRGRVDLDFDDLNRYLVDDMGYLYYIGEDHSYIYCAKTTDGFTADGELLTTQTSYADKIFSVLNIKNDAVSGYIYNPNPGLIKVNQTDINEKIIYSFKNENSYIGITDRGKVMMQDSISGEWTVKRSFCENRLITAFTIALEGYVSVLYFATSNTIYRIPMPAVINPAETVATEIFDTGAIVNGKIVCPACGHVLGSKEDHATDNMTIRALATRQVDSNLKTITEVYFAGDSTKGRIECITFDKSLEATLHTTNQESPVYVESDVKKYRINTGKALGYVDVTKLIISNNILIAFGKDGHVASASLLNKTTTKNMSDWSPYDYDPLLEKYENIVVNSLIYNNGHCVDGRDIVEVINNSDSVLIVIGAGGKIASVDLITGNWTNYDGSDTTRGTSVNACPGICDDGHAIGNDVNHDSLNILTGCIGLDNSIILGGTNGRLISLNVKTGGLTYFRGDSKDPHIPGPGICYEGSAIETKNITSLYYDATLNAVIMSCNDATVYTFNVVDKEICLPSIEKIYYIGHGRSKNDYLSGNLIRITKMLDEYAPYEAPREEDPLFEDCLNSDWYIFRNGIYVWKISRDLKTAKYSIDGGATYNGIEIANPESISMMIIDDGLEYNRIRGSLNAVVSNRIGTIMGAIMNGSDILFLYGNKDDLRWYTCENPEKISVIDYTYKILLSDSTKSMEKFIDSDGHFFSIDKEAMSIKLVDNTNNDFILFTSDGKEVRVSKDSFRIYMCDPKPTSENDTYEEYVEDKHTTYEEYFKHIGYGDTTQERQKFYKASGAFLTNDNIINILFGDSEIMMHITFKDTIYYEPNGTISEQSMIVSYENMIRNNLYSNMGLSTDEYNTQENLIGEHVTGSKYVLVSNDGKRGFYGYDVVDIFGNFKHVVYSLNIDNYGKNVTNESEVIAVYDGRCKVIDFDKTSCKLYLCCYSHIENGRIVYTNSIHSLEYKNALKYTPMRSLSNAWREARVRIDSTMDAFAILVKLRNKYSEQDSDEDILNKQFSIRYQVCLTNTITGAHILYETEDTTYFTNMDADTGIPNPYFKVLACDNFEDRIAKLYFGRFDLFRPSSMLTESAIQKSKFGRSINFVTYVERMNIYKKDGTFDAVNGMGIYDVKIRQINTLPNNVDVSFYILPYKQTIAPHKDIVDMSKEKWKETNRDTIDNPATNIQNEIDTTEYEEFVTDAENSLRYEFGEAGVGFVSESQLDNNGFDKLYGTNHNYFIQANGTLADSRRGYAETVTVILEGHGDCTYTKVSGILQPSKTKTGKWAFTPYFINKAEIDYRFDSIGSKEINDKVDVRLCRNGRLFHNSRNFLVAPKGVLNQSDYQVDYDGGSIVKHEGDIINQNGIQSIVSSVDGGEKRVVSITEIKRSTSGYGQNGSAIDAIRPRKPGFSYDILDHYSVERQPYHFLDLWWVPGSGYLTRANERLLALHRFECLTNRWGTETGIKYNPYETIALTPDFMPEPKPADDIIDWTLMGVDNTGTSTEKVESYRNLMDEKFPLERWSGWEWADLCFVRKWFVVFTDNTSAIKYTIEGPKQSNGESPQVECTDVPVVYSAEWEAFPEAIKHPEQYPTIPNNRYNYWSDLDFDGVGTEKFMSAKCYQYETANWKIYDTEITTHTWTTPNRPVRKTDTPDGISSDRCWYVPLNNNIHNDQGLDHNNAQYYTDEYRISCTGEPKSLDNNGQSLFIFPRAADTYIGCRVKTYSYPEPGLIGDGRLASAYIDAFGVSHAGSMSLNIRNNFDGDEIFKSFENDLTEARVIDENGFKLEFDPEHVANYCPDVKVILGSANPTTAEKEIKATLILYKPDFTQDEVEVTLTAQNVVDSAYDKYAGNYNKLMGTEYKFNLNNYQYAYDGGTYAQRKINGELKPLEISLIYWTKEPMDIEETKFIPEDVLKTGRTFNVPDNETWWSSMKRTPSGLIQSDYLEEARFAGMDPVDYATGYNKELEQVTTNFYFLGAYGDGIARYYKQEVHSKYRWIRPAFDNTKADPSNIIIMKDAVGMKFNEYEIPMIECWQFANGIVVTRKRMYTMQQLKYSGWNLYATQAVIKVEHDEDKQIYRSILTFSLNGPSINSETFIPNFTDSVTVKGTFESDTVKIGIVYSKDEHDLNWNSQYYEYDEVTNEAKYNMVYNVNHIGLSRQPKVIPDSASYSIQLTADDGYVLPNEIVLTVNNAKAIENKDYYYKRTIVNKLVTKVEDDKLQTIGQFIETVAPGNELNAIFNGWSLDGVNILSEDEKLQLIPEDRNVTLYKLYTSEKTGTLIIKKETIKGTISITAFGMEKDVAEI